MADMRSHVEQIVSEWKILADTWDAEDRKNFADNTILGKAHPELFMSTTRVIVLCRCRDVLRALLAAFDG